MNVTNSSLSNATGHSPHPRGGHQINFVPEFIATVGGIGFVAFSLLLTLPLVTLRKPKLYQSPLVTQFLNQVDEDIPKRKDELDPDVRDQLNEELLRVERNHWVRDDVEREKKDFYRFTGKLNLFGLGISLVTFVAGLVLKVEK